MSTFIYINNTIPKWIYTFRSLASKPLHTVCILTSLSNPLFYLRCENTFNILYSKHQNGGLLACQPPLWHTEWDDCSRRKIKENRKVEIARTGWICSSSKILSIPSSFACCCSLSVLALGSQGAAAHHSLLCYHGSRRARGRQYEETWNTSRPSFVGA